MAEFMMTPILMEMIVVFILGYFLIAIEHLVYINKAATALFISVIMWTLYSAEAKGGAFHIDSGQLSQIAQVIFFLIGAMAIVETMSVHNAFKVVSKLIETSDTRKLLWVISWISFFLSSVLDNLTTTLVMVTMLSKIMKKSEDRLLIGGAIVIAANAGGAWTPIGDVTTTMLWIGGQLSTFAIMKSIFIPSVVCLTASLIPIHYMLNKSYEPTVVKDRDKVEPQAVGVFCIGIGALMFTPVLKVLTGLPPFMGILFGLSVLWFFTDIVHSHESERSHLRLPHILSRVDMTGPLFFLGILLAVGSLEASGILKFIAYQIDDLFPGHNFIAVVIGLVSAVVDNIPLVAASMGMYDFPMDHSFWKLIAYTAGTGGSILVIGSAAGVVYMGLENVDFIWYVRRISLCALLGYFAGVFVYLYF